MAERNRHALISEPTSATQQLIDIQDEVDEIERRLTEKKQVADETDANLF
jgi:hypothetical protein